MLSSFKHNYQVKVCLESHPRNRLHFFLTNITSTSVKQLAPLKFSIHNLIPIYFNQFVRGFHKANQSETASINTSTVEFHKINYNLKTKGFAKVTSRHHMNHHCSELFVEPTCVEQNTQLWFLSKNSTNIFGVLQCCLAA